jgi:CubicO group peptidase (beta-lactamase class C family)
VNVGLVGRPLDVFLEQSDTRAFLVVHRDRLVYERYFDGASAEDRQTSFSAAKSFLSTLVGIAVDEGHIAGVDDPVTTYLPELAERDPRFARITVRDLLTMSSGIRYVEEGLPWSDDTLTYYGTDLRKLRAHPHQHRGAARADLALRQLPPAAARAGARAGDGDAGQHVHVHGCWQPLGRGRCHLVAGLRRQRVREDGERVQRAAVDYARFGR